MDKPEILEIILQQLPIRTQLACTLVSRQWHNTAHSLIQRYHVAQFKDQLNTLRCFTLNRSTTTSSSIYFHSLHLLSNLVSLTIASDARIAPDEINRRTAQYDPTQFCLTGLLPKLYYLRHLYLHGQDLRCRTYGKDEVAQLGGTDNAILAFAASRRSKNLPGLQTMSIISSPDLTNEGFVGYLATSLEGEALSVEGSYRDGKLTLGSSLLSLTLVNCPLLTVESLLALEVYCPNLEQLTLREVDGLFKVAEQTNNADLTDSTEVFNSLIRKNTSLHTFTFSSGLPSLPPNLFQAFNSSHSALQNLHIHPTKSIQPHHLRHFPSIYRLSITGCPKLGEELPFEYMPHLQEISSLGKGLSLSSMWKLFKRGNIRKLTLDVAGSAYETCICSENSCPQEHDQADDPLTTISNQGAEGEHQVFPPLLQNFKNQNILSSSIPSWVVAFFLSYAPASLDSISLHGPIMPTCCSVRPSPSPPLPPSSTVQPLVRSYPAYILTYWNLLLPDLLGGLFGCPSASFIPLSIKKATYMLLDYCNAYRRDTSTDSTDLNPRSTTAFASLPLTARDVVAGSAFSGRLSNKAARGEVSPEDKSDTESEMSERSFESDIGSVALQPKTDSVLPRRRRRAQSISGMPSRKAKVARRALKRSASEFMSSRTPRAKEASIHEAFKHNTDRACVDGVLTPSDDTMTVMTDSVSTSSSLLSSPLQSETTFRATDTVALPILSATEVSLAALLAVSTTLDSCSDTAPQALLTGISRLNPQQIEWLHMATKGQIIRLEW